MAAKVLLGVVALAAVVGSPFAYNHFKSPSGETQKEGENATDKQPGAEKPANTAPEAKAVVPEAKTQNPEQNDDGQGPQTDPCQLNGAKTWDEAGSPVSSTSLCVSGVVQNQRQEN